MDTSITTKNGRHIVFRLMERNDLDGIWENFNEVVAEEIYLPVYTPVKEDYEKLSWFNQHTASGMGNFCMVAIDPTKRPLRNVIGQCTIDDLEWEAATHVGVLGIIIQGGYRNTGVGRGLIQAAVDEAFTRGKKKIILSTLATNTSGFHLYQQCGFTECGRYHKQYKIREDFIDEILMEKWLD